ncbi:hypothetical protein ACNKHO_17680 [Shigella flexneri]
MMDSAEKGKAYDQAIMPAQMLSQIRTSSEMTASPPSITLKRCWLTVMR